MTFFRLLVFCLLIAAVPSAAPAEHPNVILMMADDLGWGDTGYNRHPHLKTPHLDAMAAAGLRFNRFYAAAPVCSPTRGSCMTARHPYRYGIFFANAGHMKPKELTLAEVLKEHGYTTGHFGKWHLGTLTKTIEEANRGGPNGVAHYAPPWNNGFDVCFSTEAKVPTWDPLLRPNEAKGNTWWDPVTEAADADAYGTNYWFNGERVTDDLRGDDSRIIMDRAIPFIRDAATAKKPFFAVIWFHAPHLPVVAGPKYTEMYSDFDKHSQHYWGCITALDEQVGRLRDELRRLQIDDNTMLWFCSDNGPEGNAKSPGSAGKLRGRKRSLFEGGIRVPGIVEWPARVKAGSVTDIPAVTSDYLPTILDCLEVDATDDRPIDGISLLPLLDGRMKERPEPIAFESKGQLALIDNQHKIVLTGGRGDQFMLFDLRADPGESVDLAGEHPQVLEKMAASLAEWRTSCKRSLAGKDY